ncbi:rhomboid family intramembrane serine protease [Peribacillus alkalitolerans]|uniref:rhomboid family intramembrane serine protease n=1 Tax=Peribacillus alkalitolerans TaxID=1550385 RepID=UPI0013D78A33|nr:rhomboid family intramembrane serine protease [Peribacillus alkalitolerans]
MLLRTENFQQFVRYYPIFTSIVTINILVFLCTAIPFLPNRTIFESLAGVNLWISQGEYWRLLTPIILHSSFSHLLFNCFSTVLFGPYIEKLLGSFNVLLFYILCGIAGNTATYIIHPLTYTHSGASGAIYGLLGFYLYLVMFQKRQLSTQDSQRIVVLTIVGVVMSTFQPNINIVGHLGGLMAGFFLAPIFFKNPFRFLGRFGQAGTKF